MMLAALPGTVGDGSVKTHALAQEHKKHRQVLALDDSKLRRFVTAQECEITGVTMTPDYKAIFINVQHPGEDSKSFDAPTQPTHWSTQTA